MTLYRGIRLYAVMFRHPNPRRVGRPLRVSLRLYHRARQMNLSHALARYRQEGELHRIQVTLVEHGGKRWEYHHELWQTPDDQSLHRCLVASVRSAWMRFESQAVSGLRRRWLGET